MAKGKSGYCFGCGKLRELEPSGFCAACAKDARAAKARGKGGRR